MSTKKAYHHGDLRKTLLAENKTVKYAKYAAGEMSGLLTPFVKC